MTRLQTAQAAMHWRDSTLARAFSTWQRDFMVHARASKLLHDARCSLAEGFAADRDMRLLAAVMHEWKGVVDDSRRVAVAKWEAAEQLARRLLMRRALRAWVVFWCRWGAFETMCLVLLTCCAIHRSVR